MRLEVPIILVREAVCQNQGQLLRKLPNIWVFERKKALWADGIGGLCKGLYWEPQTGNPKTIVGIL